MDVVIDNLPRYLEGFGMTILLLIVSGLAALVIGTLVAAMRTEEATLDERFAGEYSAYRAGVAPPVARRFSLARAMANKEYRAVAGLLIGFTVLYLLAK